MYIFDVNWTATTAGPSPDNNKRVELFLLGCQKAASGDPCPGCFNSKTWHCPKDAVYYTPEFCAENICRFAPNLYLTIGGGEPSDQIEDLVIMNTLLKEKGFNIFCYTWKKIEDILRGCYGETFKSSFLKLAKVTDCFIDGPYDASKRCYNTMLSDGLYNSVGSTNQSFVVKEGSDFKSYPIQTVKSILFEPNQLKISTTEKGTVIYV